MTFEEKLDRAKVGSKAAYESLCLGSADSLYTAALIALKNEQIAKSVVMAAVADGYAGISRIKDEKHLRSWLVHELTKNTVDKLKELKSSGISNTASGTFADTDRLPDVERLVFSIAAAFGYGTREISVLTGMSESAVSDKLFSAKARLGSKYEEYMTSAVSFKAPDTLKDRYRSFDESVARLERTAVIPEIPVVQAPEIVQPAVVEAPELVNVPVEQAPDLQPTVTQTAEEPVAEAVIPAPRPAGQPVDKAALAERAAFEDGPEPEENGFEPELPEKASAETADTIELPYTPPTVADDEEIFAADSPDDDDDGEEEDYEVPEEPVQGYDPTAPEPADEPAGSPDKAFDAETFISVVSAEKMKGSEFLRLIGNTRISNSVYREIEQNPHLTKKRLVELLEQSPLTEADYYKMLTAIKHRREMLDQREENRLALERAGLFDGSRKGRYKRKPKEPPKTELQMAIGLNVAKNIPQKQQPLTFDNEHTYSDNTDYEITNAAGNYSSGRPRETRREQQSEQERQVGYRPDLGAAVSAAAEELDEKDFDGAFSPTVMQDMFDDRNIEAVDPFAAIAANETGRQIKPDRIDEQRAQWEETAKLDRRRLDEQPIVAEDIEKPEAQAPVVPEKGGTGGTQEFGTVTPTAGLSDTRPFEAHFDDLEQQAAQLGNEEHGEGESITDDPLGNLSVTQIIEGVEPDKEAEMNEQILGFSPNVELTFDGETGEIPDLPIDKEIGSLYIDSGEEDIGKPSGSAEKKQSAADDEPAEIYSEPEDIYGEPEEAYDGEMPGEPRGRYKGSEFFYDDDTYHEGDNRGKIIFCIICGILLTAGAAALYFLFPKAEPSKEPDTSVSQTEQAAVSDTAADTSETTVPDEPPVEGFSEEAAFSESVSLELFTSDKYANETDERKFPTSPTREMQYMGVSGEPYEPLLTETAAASGDMIYYADRVGNKLYAIPTESEEHKPVTSVDIPSGEFHGFSFVCVGDKVYTLKTGMSYSFTVTIYSRELEKLAAYELGGDFIGAGIVDGKLILAGEFTNNFTGMPDDPWSKVPYYDVIGEDGEERREIQPSSIFAIDGARFGVSTLLFDPESAELTAVVGGYATYAQFTDSGITLLAPDDGCTYIANIGKNLAPKSIKRLKGEAFSPDCYKADGLIGIQYKGGEHGITAYKGGKILTTQELSDSEPYEIARAIAWAGDTAYVRTLKYEEMGYDGKTADMLYGFDMSGSEPAAASIEADDVFDRKLIKSGDLLAGIFAEPSESGERAGLRLSLYEYDGALKETAYTVIGLDAETPAENLKYIKSDAESDPALLAVNADGTLFAVPTEYFDGFSAVRRVVTLAFDGESFTQAGEMMFYDVKQTVPFIYNGKLYIFTDKEIIDCTNDTKTAYSG